MLTRWRLGSWSAGPKCCYGVLASSLKKGSGKVASNRNYCALRDPGSNSALYRLISPSFEFRTHFYGATYAPLFIYLVSSKRTPSPWVIGARKPHLEPPGSPGRLNTQRTPKSSQNTPRIRLSRKHAKYAANRPEPGRIDGPKISQNTPRTRISRKYEKYAATTE